MLKEFSEFIKKGNVLEMAVGFIMATYFGVIIKSLVNDIIMPPIGLLLGGVDFADFKIVLKEAQDAVVNGEIVATPEVAEVAIYYGNFVNTIITFIIVAFAVFMVIRIYNKHLRKQEAAPAPEAPPKPTREEELLIEIRDALRK